MPQCGLDRALYDACTNDRSACADFRSERGVATEVTTNEVSVYRH